MSREQQLFDALEGALTLIDMNKAPDWFVISARAAMSAAPPVPSDVQEIMRLMMPYVSACGEFDDASTDKLEEAEARVAAAFAPLQDALTALVEKNHELQFSLDGVNAMRRPLTNIPSSYRGSTLVSDTAGFSKVTFHFGKVAEAEAWHAAITGIEPEQGESHE